MGAIAVFSVSRAMLTADMAKPTLAEQRHRWVRAAGGTFEGLAERLAPFVYQFQFGLSAIQAAAAAALAEVDAAGPDSDSVGRLTEALWQACRIPGPRTSGWVGPANRAGGRVGGSGPAG